MKYLPTKYTSTYLAVLVSLACSASPKAFADPPQIRIHNHVPAFLKFWDENQLLPSDQRVRAFREQVVPSFPEFYDYKFEKWTRASKDPNQEIAKKLEAFPSIETSFRSRSRIIESEIRSALDSMLLSFGDFDANIDVHIAHTLGEMDGGGRTIGGKTVFIFGIDGIVKYHHVANDVPFYQHELFHMYHAQFLRAPNQIWSALWAEGLATYVSEQLSPGASMSEIMLDVPSGLIESCQPKLGQLFGRMESVLESESEEIYAQWFLLSPADENFNPQRAGYYLGYLIARDVHMKSGLTLKQLAQLPSDKILPLIRVSIAEQLQSLP